MSAGELSYTVITPARDEAENLARLAGSLLAQTHPPQAWLIVDDGSVDETAAIARSLAEKHSWIRVLASPGGNQVEALHHGRRDGRDVVAFAAGLDALDIRPDVAVKVDADVSFEPDYFAVLLAEFASDPALGIASGLCLEEEDSVWMPRHVTAIHVRGASRAYRWACLEDVRPLELRLGWDGIDEIKASVRGWKTMTFPDFSFRHHRALGQRDGALRAFSIQGRTSHYMGYRFFYLALRSLHHTRRNPAALAMIAGYLQAAVAREPRYDDPAVRLYLRRYQSFRNLLRRRREVLGQAN
jgi:biofilm PGA synthesis N-glycosyltransferase PgaC